MAQGGNAESQELYSLTEVACLLRISRQKIRQWLAEGRIQGVKKVGRIWRISAFAVNQIRLEGEARETDTKEQASFDYQVTHWDTKEELISAAQQLEKHRIPYVWKHRKGKWAIFRRLEKE